MGAGYTRRRQRPPWAGVGDFKPARIIDRLSLRGASRELNLRSSPALITPVIYSIVAGATCVLLVVILIATSRSTASAPESRRSLHPNFGRGAARPMPRNHTTEAVQPRIRQGLSTKAVGECVAALPRWCDS